MTNRYLTVSALTKYIKRKMETDHHLRDVWLKGEISNFKHHNRGHMYLTIKDEQSRIQAVMFASQNRRLTFMPEDGMHVLIRGEISVYEPYGQYQLYIHQMEPDGLGSLYLAFEQLKEKLSKQGYFDEKHKRAIPTYPKHIGLVTSPTSAAVRDMITTIKRRFPITRITIIPAIVQGEQGPESIVQGIEKANQLGIFDVLIVGRGGGSIEELWCFNDERVAMAIFHSKIPVISAVGHETDITISDFIADHRAATPTGAAEIAVPSQVELMDKLMTMRRSIQHMVHSRVKNYQNHLIRLKQSYAFRYPDQLIKQKNQELDQITDRMDKALTQHHQVNKDKYQSLHRQLKAHHPEAKLKQAIEKTTFLHQRLSRHLDQLMELRKRQLVFMMEKLTLLNPLEIMKRGYAIPYHESGKIVTSTTEVTKEDFLKIKVHDGDIHCQVLEVKENENV